MSRISGFQYFHLNIEWVVFKWNDRNIWFVLEPPFLIILGRMFESNILLDIVLAIRQSWGLGAFGAPTQNSLSEITYLPNCLVFSGIVGRMRNIFDLFFFKIVGLNFTIGIFDLKYIYCNLYWNLLFIGIIGRNILLDIVLAIRQSWGLGAEGASHNSLSEISVLPNCLIFPK